MGNCLSGVAGGSKANSITNDKKSYEKALKAYKDETEMEYQSILHGADNLPQMEGTPRQIEYAESIRKRLFENLAFAYNSSREKVLKKAEEIRSTREKDLQRYQQTRDPKLLKIANTRPTGKETFRRAEEEVSRDYSFSASVSRKGIKAVADWYKNEYFKSGSGRNAARVIKNKDMFQRQQIYRNIDNVSKRLKKRKSN